MKKTKIIATIGPKTRSLEIVEKLIDAGMDVARLNFSHDVHEQHGLSIKYIRQASKVKNKPIAILQDLQGARVRTGILPEEGIKIAKGELIVLADEKEIDQVKIKDKKIISVTYPSLTKTVKVGHELYIQDKLVELITRKVEKGYIICESKREGVIYEHKGINFPHSKVDLPTITTKDKRDIQFGVKSKVDYIALSFVRSAQDVRDLRLLLKKYAKDGEREHFRVVVKIECLEAIKNFDEILAVTDAVMIARGDLGIEMPPEEIPFLQKELIIKCLQAAKPVITATHMLDSMIKNLHPTRAEVSDVANAILDHTDAIMLSGETANGKYPVESVEMMSRVAVKTESSPLSKLDIQTYIKQLHSAEYSMCLAVNSLAEERDMKAILVVSLSGKTARMISRYRPNLPIFVATDSKETERHLSLSRGAFPFYVKYCKDIEKLIANSLEYLKKNKKVEKGDKIIVIAGRPFADAYNIGLIKTYII